MRLLWLLLCSASPALAQTDGSALFARRCESCHSAESAGQGPALSGVFGRRAAAAPDFQYSAALQKSGIVWDAPALDAYLAAPRKHVPGTTMILATPRAEDRAALIAYLETLQ
jgi:cytochrome c